MIYNNMKNDTNDAYLYIAIAIKIAEQKNDKSDYNMQTICHKKKKENAEGKNLIKMKIFKLTSRNVIKRPRIHQNKREINKITTMRAAESAVKQFAI